MQNEINFLVNLLKKSKQETKAENVDIDNQNNKKDQEVIHDKLESSEK